MAADTSAFSKLFTKNVPQIFEKIFLSLDYTSFRNCHEVCNAWSEVLMTESFKIKIICKYSAEMHKDLYVASRNGNSKEIKFLISIGVDVNEKLFLAHTPLITAIILHNNDVVRLLLDAGADPNTGSNTQTPLRWAIVKGNKEAVKMLLDGGVDPNKKSNLYWAAFYTRDNGYAVSYDILKLLIDGGAQPTAKDRRMMEEYGYITNEAINL